MTTNSKLADHVLDWYAQNARSLPWRGLKDPYAIWVSEIMLQQTRVETVADYFMRWMKCFPTVESLAQAPLVDVLKEWEGLGYYSRARNLHRAARIVVQEYGGQLPADILALRKLPGIGRYTAGAITSIAFGMDYPALDGNIRRVFARIFNLTEDLRSTSGEKKLWELAEQHLPPGKAGDYNQALMDLGAIICVSRSPRCQACPLKSFCQAYALGVQEERPVPRAKADIPHYVVTAAVIRQNGTVLIAQRPAEGLLGGMWEFPGGKVQAGEDLASCLQREIREELGVTVAVGRDFGVYQHAYTHFRVTLHAFLCTLVDGQRPQPLQAQEVQWVQPDKLADYPMGKIDRQIAGKITGLYEQDTSPL
ncbi:MAG TPA: A/G-specific adenine glycosylase [Anaerolineales bacterium]|nr:A/G-specific adenine glycosylase [Anaerolineales bacterium]